MQLRCCSVIVHSSALVQYTHTYTHVHRVVHSLANQASAIYVADTLIATFALRSECIALRNRLFYIDLVQDYSPPCYLTWPN